MGGWGHVLLKPEDPPSVVSPSEGRASQGVALKKEILFPQDRGCFTFVQKKWRNAFLGK